MQVGENSVPCKLPEGLLEVGPSIGNDGFACGRTGPNLNRICAATLKIFRHVANDLPQQDRLWVAVLQEERRKLFKKVRLRPTLRNDFVVIANLQNEKKFLWCSPSIQVHPVEKIQVKLWKKIINLVATTSLVCLNIKAFITKDSEEKYQWSRLQAVYGCHFQHMVHKFIIVKHVPPTISFEA